MKNKTINLLRDLGKFLHLMSIFVVMFIWREFPKNSFEGLGLILLMGFLIGLLITGAYDD